MQRDSFVTSIRYSLPQYQWLSYGKPPLRISPYILMFNVQRKIATIDSNYGTITRYPLLHVGYGAATTTAQRPVIPNLSQQRANTRTSIIRNLWTRSLAPRQIAALSKRSYRSCIRVWATQHDLKYIIFSGYKSLKRTNELHTTHASRDGTWIEIDVIAQFQRACV